MGVKNGLSAIAEAVLSDVQKEAETIIISAENQAKQTLKVAREQASKNYSSIMEQAKATAEGEKRKIASVTDVEIRNRLLRKKEALVDIAFEKALIRLKDFVTKEEYQSYLLQLIQGVAKNIGQKNLVIQVNSKDKAWLTQDILNSACKKLRCELKLLDQTGDYIGGFKMQTADGKIMFDSTIDNTLKELKPVLRVEIAKIMFGKET